MALKFTDWMEEIRDPSYPVYILSGNYAWKKELIDAVRKKYACEYDLASKDIKKQLDRLRFKSLMKSMNILLFESVGKLSKKDLEDLKVYLQAPSKNGVLLISLGDWKEKRMFTKEFKFLKRSEKIRVLDLDWVYPSFVESYVRLKTSEIGLSFENAQASKLFVQRIGNGYDKIVGTLESLKSFSTKISVDDVREFVIDESQSTMDDFYATLVKLDRKTIPYKILHELMEDREPQQVMRGIQIFFKYLYQAKFLKIKGILLNNDIISEQRKLYLRQPLKFSNPDIWKLSNAKMNKYLALSDFVSLREILWILNEIEGAYERVLRGDKVTEYITAEKFYLTIYKILGRRVDSGKESLGIRQ